MKLGIVIGKVVSTKKEGNLSGHPILIVHYLNKELKLSGITVAAVDTVNAGEKDVVLLCASSSARKTEKTRNVATDCTIIGIVDSITAGAKELLKQK